DERAARRHTRPVADAGRCPRRRTDRGGPALPGATNPGRGMTSELCRLDATEVAKRVADKDVSAVEVAQAHLDRIAALDGDYHSFLHVDVDGALAQAKRV